MFVILESVPCMQCHLVNGKRVGKENRKGKVSDAHKICRLLVACFAFPSPSVFSFWGPTRSP